MADKTVRILLVEDNNAIRDLYKQLLLKQGYDVDVAENGNIALEKAKIGGFDLILLDLMMPGISGVDVLKILQTNPPQTKNHRIVVLTNLSDESLIEKALELGAIEYWNKPSDPNVLIGKIKNLLG